MNALRTGIWWSGNLTCLLGLLTHTIAVISDRTVTAIAPVPLLLFIAWLFLKPKRLYDV